MKRKETSQVTTTTTKTTESLPIEVNHNVSKPLKRYKSENVGPTFDPQTYTETLDKYKPVRGLTENSSLTKHREERESIFQEKTVLINRFQHTLDDSSGSPSFNTQSSNSSADTDPRVKKEKELAFIRGRQPGFEQSGKYDPANAENLPKVLTEVKESIELDVDDEIYRPRGNSDQTTESGETKRFNSSSDHEGSVSSTEDDFSIGAAVTTVETHVTTIKTTKTTTISNSTTKTRRNSSSSFISEKADEETTITASSNNSETDDNNTN